MAKKAKKGPSKAAHDGGDVRAMLLAGVDGFNAWRHAHLDAAIDLTGAELAGADLRGAFLAGARMDACDLDDVALSGAVLSGASLTAASLRRADLRGACFGFSELVEASLAMSPVGSALVQGASLRGASLQGARAGGARFTECDLSGADLTDCDLVDADLTRADLTDAVQSGPPPSIERDPDALWERLRGEPLAVREGILLFGLMVHLGGGSDDESADVLSGFLDTLGLDQGDVDRVSPRGPVVLEQLSITPPDSQWSRRVVLVMMAGLAGASPAVAPLQLQVLGHFGEQLGFGSRAMARILGEELGLSLSVAG